MAFRLSKRSLRRLEGTEEIIQKIVKKGITNSPYDFGIAWMGGLRTPEQQNMLYRNKKSQLDGYKKKSYHQTGRAFDIVIYINGKPHWGLDKYEDVAKHLKKIAKEEFGVTLRWGGDWDGDGVRVDKDPDERFLDAVHFEVR